MSFVSNFLVRPMMAITKQHKILSLSLFLMCSVFGVFGYWIGFVQILILLAPVSLFTWILIMRLVRKNGITGGMAEAITICSFIALSSVATFAVIQVVPYGKNHTNPSTYNRQYEPKWDSPITRELTVRACFGCHSNEVEYPTYAKVAPISWMVASHVSDGRSELNFSTFEKYTNQDRVMQRILRVIKNGSMPPSYYTHLGKHPEAKLSADEIAKLVAGLTATGTM